MMTVTFNDWEEDENPLNGTVVRSSDELRKILLGLRVREPFACELEGENGACLVLGIGRLGTAQYNREEGEARFCLPFGDIIKIAVHFMKTGETCPLFAWEMI